MQSELKDGAYR